MLHSLFRPGRGVSRGFVAATAAVAVTFSAGAAVPLIATAQETAEQPAADMSVEDLIDRVSEVAREVSAKAEEVKAAEDELAAAESELADFQRKADKARAQAASAADAVIAQQANVDGIAQTRYRGVNLDPVTTALNSTDPQNAVERLGYLGAISRDAQRNLSTMAQTLQAADSKRADADSAVKAAADKARELEAQRRSLVAEQESLEEQKREIEAQVDALDPEQRAAWEAQNGSNTEFDPAALAALAGDGSLGAAAASAALSRTGSPYGWGATGPNVFDCSGLMVWSYAQQGKTIPRTSQAQLAGGTPVPLDQLQPGDIVGYFPGTTHVGMYIGNGQIVHASTYGVPVATVPLHSMPVSGAVRY